MWSEVGCGKTFHPAAFDASLATLRGIGAEPVEIDFQPFVDAARLLYEGPWVAERYIVLKSLLASQPEAIHPVTKEIILQGARPSALARATTGYINPPTCSGTSRAPRCARRSPSALPSSSSMLTW